MAPRHVRHLVHQQNPELLNRGFERHMKNQFLFEFLPMTCFPIHTFCSLTSCVSLLMFAAFVNTWLGCSLKGILAVFGSNVFLVQLLSDCRCMSSEALPTHTMGNCSVLYSFVHWLILVNINRFFRVPFRIPDSAL